LFATPRRHHPSRQQAYWSRLQKSSSQAGHLDHLFDSFFTTKDSGIGLGLRISRSIIEAHGECIRADSDSTCDGTRLSFTLPAKLH